MHFYKPRIYIAAILIALSGFTCPYIFAINETSDYNTQNQTKYIPISKIRDLCNDVIFQISQVKNSVDKLKKNTLDIQSKNESTFEIFLNLKKTYIKACEIMDSFNPTELATNSEDLQVITNHLQHISEDYFKYILNTSNIIEKCSHNDLIIRDRISCIDKNVKFIETFIRENPNTYLLPEISQRYMDFRVDTITVQHMLYSSIQRHGYIRSLYQKTISDEKFAELGEIPHCISD